MFHQVATIKSINSIVNASEAKLMVFYRKFLTKYQSYSNHIWFLTQCLKYNVHPKFMKITCNHKSVESSKAIVKTYTIWMKYELKKWYYYRDNIKHHLKIAHCELNTRLHPILFDVIDRQIRDFVQEQTHDRYQKQRKKLDQLINSKTKPKPSDSNEKGKFVSFAPRIKNLTTITFSDSETKLLHNGLKYSPPFKSDKEAFEKLSINTELIIKHADIGPDKNFLKHNVASIIKKEYEKSKTTSRNTQPSDWNAIKNLKKKLNNNNLVMCKADKGNTITIMRKEDYIQKTEEVISASDCVVIRDPTIKYQATVVEALKTCKSVFSDSDKFLLKNMNPQPPILYALPKIHKENIPMRPIASYLKAPAYKICQKINKLLPEVIKFRPNYSIKNSLDLINFLKNVKPNNSFKLVSFDVKNLFPSIPVEELKTIISDHINTHNLDPMLELDLITLVNICLDQNYFQFNDKIYKQNSGLPMGSPTSPLFAEIFMNHFENSLFKKQDNIYLPYIKLWKRYVDDIFCIWQGSDRQLDKFLNYLNNINRNITFTCEKENACKTLNFLDLSIRIVNNSFEFNIFRKDTFCDTLIPNNSNQSQSVKLSALNSLVHRLLTIPLNDSNFCEELINIEAIARNNGYDPRIIKQLIRKKQQKLAQNLLYSPSNIRSPQKWFYLNYIPVTSYKIKNILNKFNINVTITNKSNIGHTLINNKPKVELNKKSGVYKLKCNDCNHFYIGQSGRPVKTRTKEHQKAILDKKHKTGFATHCIENNHHYDGNFQILHNLEKSHLLTLYETFEINKAVKSGKPITNDQTDLDNSPLLNLIL